jgi:hypothetical protein
MTTSRESPTVRERIGTAAGWLAAPMFGAIARARHARVFHPEGIVLAARVEPIAHRDLSEVAMRLAGPALVRFSTALWRHGTEWPDALGCAIRFRDRDVPSAEADPGDQDLLFATIRTPVATPMAPVGTHVHDFLDNTYFATAPFDVEGVGRAKWRLVPEHVSPPGRDRSERLIAAVACGFATLRLDLRRTWHPRYAPVVRLVLVEAVDVDQEALRFSPFRDGRGLLPRGFVHALRRGAYVASRKLGHPE